MNDDKIKDLAQHYLEILKIIGEDPEREGLQKTPMRVAKALKALTEGYNVNPKEILLSSRFLDNSHQMVIIKDIDIHSLCEHHMLPFFGKAHIAYIPNEYITGLSKIAKVVDAYSKRLQVQERLTSQILECIEETLSPLGVAVVIEAVHLCMVMRGVQKLNSVTTTSLFSGKFLEDKSLKEEFLLLIKNN